MSTYISRFSCDYNGGNHVIILLDYILMYLISSGCTFRMCILFMEIGLAFSIAIDNEVSGAQIRCWDGSIDLSFVTRNAFRGRIFAKGLSGNQDCFKDFAIAPTTTPQISFDLSTCNMQHTSTFQPQKGVYHSLTVIISFHKIFVTSVDRAYKAQCFYMEAEKIVTSSLEVSMISTQAIYDTATMPNCSYTIRQDGPQGPLLRFATVGSPAYHVWRCDSNNHNILVTSCSVNDGDGTSYDVLDERGCTVDDTVMPDILYSKNGDASAWVEAHVFKFADKPNVFFQCSIKICSSAADSSCDTSMRPPKCRKHVKKRSPTLVMIGNSSVILLEPMPNESWEHAQMDVVTPVISVFEIEATSRNESLIFSRQQQPTPRSTEIPAANIDVKQAGVCMSLPDFGGLLATTVASFAVTAIVAGFTCAGRKSVANTQR